MKQYPYVIWRPLAAVYIRKELSSYELQANASLTQMVERLRQQSIDHNQRLCLVLSEFQAMYFEPTGEVISSDRPPTGGAAVS